MHRGEGGLSLKESSDTPTCVFPSQLPCKISLPVDDCTGALLEWKFDDKHVTTTLCVEIPAAPDIKSEAQECLQ